MLQQIKEAITIFFSLSYLFNRNVGPYPPAIAKALLFFLLAFMLLGLLWRSKFTKNKDIFAKKVGRRFFKLSWTMGIIGFVLWFFRQINIAYLSSPFMFLIWGIILLVWLGFWLNYWIKTVPRRRKQLSQDRVLRSYLP